MSPSAVYDTLSSLVHGTLSAIGCQTASVSFFTLPVLFSTTLSAPICGTLLFPASDRLIALVYNTFLVPLHVTLASSSCETLPSTVCDITSLCQFKTGLEH